jgi:hypothetical protein
MDARDLMAGARPKRGGAARSRGEGSPETRGRPQWDSSGLGKGSDTFNATRRTRPCEQKRHGGARERRPRWERFRSGAASSGEQLRGRWGDTW